ncbi:hypothetical protein ACEQPO_02610 [Bacillus sp. SL00103]
MERTGYIDVAKPMTHQGAVYAVQSPGLYEDEEPQFLHYTGACVHICRSH